MSTQAALGQKALEAKNYDGAIQHYTEALKSSQSPIWLTQRSTAHQRQGSHELALYDAEDAVLQAISRGRRELIAAGQLRRAIALFSLERYGDARLCFTWVRKLNEKEKGLGMWQAKVVQEFEKAPEDSEKRIVTIKEIPDRADRKFLAESEPKTRSGIATSPATLSTTAIVGTESTTPAQTSKEKIRHEWYQSNSKVTITIFAKNVPKDKADIEFSPESLDVSFPTGSGANYHFTLLPTFHKIDVSHSTFIITPNKIEISLQKETSGLKWPALEGTNTEPISIKDDGTSSTSPKIIHGADENTSLKAPAYPTSSRKGTKNWDIVAKDALKKEKTEAAKDGDKETVTLDDDDLDDEGDPLQGFFKKLYKDASPDTRRAMMKSYVESNGTALSTDWNDVGKKTIPVNPPDGIEAKKWDT